MREWPLNACRHVRNRSTRSLCATRSRCVASPEVAVPPDTPKAELEAVLAELDAHKAEWAALPLPEKAAIFRACMQTTIEVRSQTV